MPNENKTKITREIEVNLPTKYGIFNLVAYTHADKEHLALTQGSWNKNDPVLVRMHSSCVTGDIFGSCRCDCGDQLDQAMRMIANEGKGALIYLNQE